MLYTLLWKDCAEVAVLAIIFYYTACWLQYGKNSHLLRYACLFALGTLCAYLLELSTLTTLLLWYSPTIATLFALVHQNTLQRNFVALTYTSPTVSEPDDWLETLMSVCLYNMHHARATHCIIQHTQNLSDFITSAFLLNTPIQQNLLTVLCDSSSYDETACIWIQTNGTVRGINARCKENYFDEKTDAQTRAARRAQSVSEQMLTLVRRTDAALFSLDPITHLCSVSIGNTIFKHISAHHALQLIKKHCLSASKSKGLLYEKINRTPVQQHSA